MLQKLLSSLPIPNLKVNKVAILIYGVSFALIIALGLQKQVPPSFLTRDVIATVQNLVKNSGIEFYYGSMSVLGALMWCASGAICIFGALVLNKLKVKRQASFLMYAGFISLFLMFDDQFLLHEVVFPDYIGIHEYVILSLYPLSIAGYFILFYKEILRSQFLLLISGLGFLGISMVVDMFGLLPTFVEDGFKFLGITGWLLYQLHTTFEQVLKAVPNRKHIIANEQLIFN